MPSDTTGNGKVTRVRVENVSVPRGEGVGGHWSPQTGPGNPDPWHVTWSGASSTKCQEGMEDVDFAANSCALVARMECVLRTFGEPACLPMAIFAYGVVFCQAVDLCRKFLRPFPRRI